MRPRYTTAVSVLLVLALSAPALATRINHRTANARKELGLLRGIEMLDFDIEKHRQRVSLVGKRLLELQKRLRVLASRVTTLEKQIREQREYFAGRMGSIRYIKQRGALQLFLETDSFSRYVHKRWLLNRLLEQDQKRILDYRALEKRLADETRTHNALATKLAGMQVELVSDEGKLAKLREDKLRILESVKRNRAYYLRYREELSRSTVRLVRELLKARARVERKTFVSMKRRFHRPIWGTLLRRFGQQIDLRFKTLTQHNGLLFRARLGQRVRSAYSGRVAFVGSVGGYGTVVIVDHSQHVFTLYGHLDKVLVHKNQFVTRGESLALAGRSGFRTTPALYFEVRENGRAVDPFLYLRR